MFVSEREYHSAREENALRYELQKGMQSVKSGDVYTLEEAWKEIDMFHL